MSHGEGASLRDRAGRPTDGAPAGLRDTATIPSAAHTPGPWYVTEAAEDLGYCRIREEASDYVLATADDGGHVDPRFALPPATIEANARLIAAAPDHALICWAMCVQDGRWEEWVPYDGSGEFVFAGLRYATRVDEFGCPRLTPALRRAITQSQQVPA
jgi:hypothetical protein